LNGQSVSAALNGSSSPWEDELMALYRQELSELRRSEQAKQAEIEELRAVVARLRQHAPDDQPIGGCYTRVQINAIILNRFGKNHGVMKALIERNSRQRKTDSSLPKITDGLVQQWRREDRYPAFVVEHLRTLDQDDLLTKRPWSPEEMHFLVSEFTSNPSLSNQELAIRCTKKFGRHITDCAIRGALTRARAAKMADYRNTYPSHNA